MFGFFLLFTLFIGSYGLRHYLHSPLEVKTLESAQLRSNDLPATEEPVRDVYGLEAVVPNLTIHRDFENFCSAWKGYYDCSVHWCGPSGSVDGNKRLYYALIEIGCANINVFEEDDQCDKNKNYTGQIEVGHNCPKPFLYTFFASLNDSIDEEAFVNDNYCKPAIETMKCEYPVLKRVCNKTTADITVLSLENIIKRYLEMKNFKEAPSDCQTLYKTVEEMTTGSHFSTPAPSAYTPPTTVLTTTTLSNVTDPSTSPPSVTDPSATPPNVTEPSATPPNVTDKNNVKKPVTKPDIGHDNGASMDPINMAISMSEASTVLILAAAIICAAILA